jgi:hypothetical protein
MSSSSNLSVPEDAAGGRALPSFTPVRRDPSRDSEDKPESSTSGNRRSARSSTHDEPATVQIAKRDEVEPSEDNHVNRMYGTVRRSRPYSSGGFLLDTALHPRRAFLSRSKKAGKSGDSKYGTQKLDVKGKRPRDESEIVLPKRRARDVKHEKALSIGGSPLATEIKQDTDNEGGQENGLHIAGTASRKSTFLQNQSTVSPGHGSSLGKSRAPESVGYDTDPAQIVNMALILNEKRKGQVSGARVVSGQSAGTRAMSGAVHSQVGPGAQFTTPTRALPRFTSQSSDSNVMKRMSGTEQNAFVGGLVALENDTSDMDISLPISHATESRVQKARTYFELAYEHRRLLSHLPPVQRPGTTLQSLHTKVYNPLQYSRNRKLRFSEKHPIASEAEGWHNVDQVRDWVGKVIEADPVPRHDPEECIRLPDLAYNKPPTREEDEDDDDLMLLDSPASSLRRSSVQKPAKPTRPRSDWVTHPGDLIADAFWLEQGQNKLKIVDGDGNKIYPPDTRFKFSGWRNRTPIDVPERLQEPTPPREQDVNEESIPSPPPSALPELPTFTSTHKDKGLKHGRRKKPFRGKFGKDHKDHLLDDGAYDYSSSADDSDEEAQTRGRKVFSRKRQKSRDVLLDSGSWKPKSASDPLFLQNHGSSGDYSLDRSANSSKRPSIDHTRLSKLFTRDSRTDSSKNDSRTRSDSGRRKSSNDLPSRTSYDGGSVRRSSAEYDTTAPTSPTGMAFPSIAIHLSPPQSRSPSPSKRILQSILTPFRDRNQNKLHDGIDVNDFGKIPSRQQTRQSSNEADLGNESSDHASRGTSPMTRGTNDLTKSVSNAPTQYEPPNAVDEHRGSTVSRISTKSTNTDGHSKVRGIFKGGRIAELVGNEVSKVSDYIWKRDVPSSIRRKDSLSSSINSYHASDSDDEPYQNGSMYKTPLQYEKRFPSSETEAHRAKRLSPDSHSSPESGGKVDPRYHNPNLPSFTSPFEKDKDTQDEKKRNALSPSQSPEEAKEGHDHISHIAAEHRNATKSPRLDRLAPPKLNMSRSASPHAPFTTGEYDRRSSYGFGYGDRDFSKSRNASQVFNDALKTNGIMVTGLASIHPAKSRSRSRVDLFRTTSYQSTSSAAVEVKDVSKRDIAFTSALLLSSAIKAREIDIRANAVRDPPPAFLLDTIDSDNEALQSSGPLRVRRKEEHMVAARNLIARLEKDGQKFQIKVQSFQSNVVPQLQMALQALEDLVYNGLTPRVRKSGDEAGELSMKLSTTSTLAVKDVNERIDAAMRRRRRGPVRWLRRFAYLYIEWVVVALLWGIWAVVTALRVVRALAVFFVRATRWLLFI